MAAWWAVAAGTATGLASLEASGRPDLPLHHHGPVAIGRPRLGLARVEPQRREVLPVVPGHHAGQHGELVFSKTESLSVVGYLHVVVSFRGCTAPYPPLVLGTHVGRSRMHEHEGAGFGQVPASPPITIGGPWGTVDTTRLV